MPGRVQEDTHIRTPRLACIEKGVSLIKRLPFAQGMSSRPRLVRTNGHVEWHHPEPSSPLADANTTAAPGNAWLVTELTA